MSLSELRADCLYVTAHSTALTLAAAGWSDPRECDVEFDALTSSAHLYTLAYRGIRDLVPVVQYTRQPLVLAVHPSLGVSTLAELVAAAKAKPGLGYATSGAGSGQHIAGEWLAQLAGIKLTHVPYKGGGQAIGDLIGGQVPIASLGSTPVMPHRKAGKVRIIAQSTESRAARPSSLPRCIAAITRSTAG